MRNFPAPSIVRASVGTRTVAAGPTCVMRSPSTTTVMSVRAGPPVVSMTVTCAMARGTAGVAGAAGWRRTAARTSGSIVPSTLPDGFGEKQRSASA